MFHEAQRIASRDGHVEVAKAYYSVPPEYLGLTVWVRWDTRVVRVFNQRFEQIAMHARHEQGRFSTQAMRHLPITQVSHLFLAREIQRLRGKNPEVTLPQVHTAINAVIDSLPLPPQPRRLRLQRTAEIVTHWQHRNQQARISHAKRRLKELDLQGISLEELPRCRSG